MHASRARKNKSRPSIRRLIFRETRFRNIFRSAHRAIARSRHRGVSSPVAGPDKYQVAPDAGAHYISNAVSRVFFLPPNSPSPQRSKILLACGLLSHRNHEAILPTFRVRYSSDFQTASLLCRGRRSPTELVIGGRSPRFFSRSKLAEQRNSQRELQLFFRTKSHDINA